MFSNVTDSFRPSTLERKTISSMAVITHDEKDGQSIGSDSVDHKDYTILHRHQADLIPLDLKPSFDELSGERLI